MFHIKFFLGFVLAPFSSPRFHGQGPGSACVKQDVWLKLASQAHFSVQVLGVRNITSWIICNTFIQQTFT